MHSLRIISLGGTLNSEDTEFAESTEVFYPIYLFSVFSVPLWFGLLYYFKGREAFSYIYIITAATSLASYCSGSSSVISLMDR